MRKSMSENYFSKLTLKIVLPLLLLLPLTLVKAQGFTEVPTGIQGFVLSSVSWIDFDQDGKLDISVSGRDSTSQIGFPNRSRLYRNTGTGFVEVLVPFQPLSKPATRWLDVDHDGDLDFIMMGADSLGSPQSRLYLNAAGIFSLSPFAVVGAHNPLLCTGDIDNDGQPDFLGAGFDPNFVAFAGLYWNSDGQFSNSNQALTGLALGNAAFLDIDNDADLDYVFAGEDENAIETSGINLNQNGNLVNSTWTTPIVGRGSISVGDFDADGDQDLAIGGASGGSAYSEILRNNGGIFAEHNAGLLDLEGKVAWGDLNNDGDLELLQTGFDGTTNVTKIYDNASGVFTDVGVVLPGIVGQGVLGDYDNDGDLDLLLVGQLFQSNSIFKLYRNDFATIVNTPPAAPSGLSYTFNADSSITFQWQAPSGDQTPSAGLSYSLNIGTTPGGSEIVSAPADLITGYRRVVEYGQVVTTTWTLKNVSCANDYYFRVQAVDGGYMGSAFSAPLHVIISPTASVAQGGNTLTAVVAGPAATSYEWTDASGVPIPGATSSSYTITNTVFVGLIVTSGQCTDTVPPANRLFIGTENPHSVSNVKVWPNPSSTVIRVRVDNPGATESIAIYDMQGRLMRIVESGFDAETNISVEGLSTGLYLLKLTLQDGRGIATATFRKD
jgi:Secretion system C-terminal sorting domain/FG-GAP-like repeat